MSNPSKYTKSYDFEGFQEANPTTPLPAIHVDSELIDVAASISTLVDAVKEVRRSDGALKNAIVTPDSLSAATRSLLLRETNPVGAWAAATVYAVKDAVSHEGATYVAVSAHTSGSAFSDDLDAGKWLLIATPYSLSGAVFVELLSGNGSDSTFTLSQAFNSVTELSVYVQDGSGGYQILRSSGDSPQVSLSSGTSLTFSSVPGSGTDNIMVVAVNQGAAASSAAAAASAVSASGYASDASGYADDAALSAVSASGHASDASDYADAASGSASSASGAAAAAQAAADSIGFRDVVYLTAASSPYSVVQATSGKLLSCDTSSGAIVVNLPEISGLVLPFTVGVKKATGDGNAVTINAGGSDTIDGASAKVLSSTGGTTLIPDEDPSPDMWNSADWGGGQGQQKKQVFADGVDYTAGTSATLTITEAPVPTSADALSISFDGAEQFSTEWSYAPDTGVVTFDAVIPLGVLKIEAKWISPLAIGTPADGTVTAGKIASGDASGIRTAIGAAGAADLSEVADDVSDHETRITTLESASGGYLHVREEQASGTDGGTFTAGSYLTRVLNTTKVNTIAGASLASNRVTLPAGTYDINGVGTVRGVDYNKVRIYDVTHSAVLLIGPSNWNSSTYAGGPYAWVRGRITLTEETVLEMQHRCTTTFASTGFGKAVSFGDAEVYSELIVWKVA